MGIMRDPIFQRTNKRQRVCIMKSTEDLRVKGYHPLMIPSVLKKQMPLSDRAIECVNRGRESIEGILSKRDKRLLVIVGPCSIHDEKTALEYAQRLSVLKEKVEETLLLVMRVYFEKPRTTIGWKGLINDPSLDGTCNISEGLHMARWLLLRVTEMGLPTATEFLDPITPQYVADLICWAAVGARTIESQTHREMASGLSMPVGFKNGTDGNMTSAINAMLAAKAPQSFLGIDQEGTTCVVKTAGNPWGHIVLRGGKRPNYDPITIEEARLKLIEKGLPEAVMVDCSHGNCMKKYQGQPVVWKNVIAQCLAGSEAVIGLMLESNLHEGNQAFNGDWSTLRYGVSITDECISWETTEALITNAHDRLMQTSSRV